MAKLILMFLSLGTATVPTSSASAAGGCSDIGCAGHDPISYGCAVTSTTSQTGTWATVWNRYSYGCKANWARAQLTAAAVNAGYTMWVEIDAPNTAEGEEHMCWPNYPSQDNQGDPYEFCNPALGPYGGSSVVYTDMVDGTNITYALVTVFDTYWTVIAEYHANQ
jgi:hypothetical protein